MLWDGYAAPTIKFEISAFLAIPVSFRGSKLKTFSKKVILDVQQKVSAERLIEDMISHQKINSNHYSRYDLALKISEELWPELESQKDYIEYS